MWREQFCDNIPRLQITILGAYYEGLRFFPILWGVWGAKPPQKMGVRGGAPGFFDDFKQINDHFGAFLQHKSSKKAVTKPNKF